MRICLPAALGVIAASSALLVACHGGAAPLPAVTNALQFSQPPGIGADVGANGTAAFALLIPTGQADATEPEAIGPNYVSPKTAKMRITLTLVNGGRPEKPVTTLIATTPGSPDCNNKTPRTCSVSLSVPPGKDTFEIKLYDSSGIATQDILALGKSIARIPSNKTVHVPIETDGVIAVLAISPATIWKAADGATYDTTLTVIGKDAAGDTITSPNPYSTPIALKITGDTNGALGITPKAITSPGPKDGSAVALTYDSSVTLKHGIITATAAKDIKPATTSVDPLILTPISQPSLSVGAIKSSSTFSLSEYDESNAYSINIYPFGSKTGVSIACVQSHCKPAAPGASVKVKITPSATALGLLRISDKHAAHQPIATYNLPYGVTALAFFHAIAKNATLESVTLGQDGHLWGLISTGYVVRSTTTGLSTFYTLPDWISASDGDIAVGPPKSNTVWYVDGIDDTIAKVSTAAGSLGKVTRYTTKDQGTATSIIAGPDASMWYTENNGAFGKISVSGAKTKWTNKFSSNATQILPGVAGTLWMVSENELFKTQTTGRVTSYGNPKDTDGNPIYINAIAYSSNNQLLLAANSEVCAFTIDVKAQWCIQSPISNIQAIALGSSGTIWTNGVDSFSHPTLGCMIYSHKVPNAVGQYTWNLAFPVQEDASTSGPHAFTNGANDTIWFAAGPGGLDRIAY